MISVSVVIPAKNEEDNISRLVDEIHAALDGRFDYEIIYINDGSADRTLDEIHRLQEEDPNLKVWTHQSSAGQSRAMHHGILLAKYPIIATLDADGQNDPADIPAMVEQLVGLNSPGPIEASGAYISPSIFDTPGQKTALIAGFRKNAMTHG